MRLLICLLLAITIGNIVIAQALSPKTVSDFKISLNRFRNTSRFNDESIFWLMKEGLPKKSNYEIQEALEAFEKQENYTGFFFGVYKRSGGNIGTFKFHLLSICKSTLITNEIWEKLALSFKAKLKDERMQEQTKKTEKLDIGKSTKIIEDTKAEFIGGIGAKYRFIQENIQTPKNVETELNGIVTIEFTVDIDGTIKNPKIVESLGKEYDLEAIRVVMLMPKWNPAISAGKPIPSQMKQYFRF